MEFIGVNLLFAEEDDKTVIGHLISFILHRHKTFTEIQSKCKNMAKKYITTQKKNKIKVRYLGIEDVFGIVGPIENGALLGKASYFEYDTLSKAKSLIEKPESFYCNYEFNKYLAEAIFTAKDDQGLFTISCLALIEEKVSSEAVEKAIKTIKSKKFRGKVRRLDNETLNNLTFIGLRSLEDISSKDLMKEPFRWLYSEFTDIKELKEKLSEKDVEAFYQTVIASD